MHSKNLDRIYSPIQSSLKQVKKELVQRFTLTDLKVRPQPGKYLRPALNLFAAHAFEATSNKACVLLATALELIHTASLIHDDIVDNTPVRRTDPALHIPLGLRKALILGDHMFAHALKLVGELDNPAILASVVETIKTMCDGQWTEINLDRNGNFSQETYLDIIRNKTASLFACSCRAGALLRGAGEKEACAFHEFGAEFGTAFQIVDDLDDLTNGPQDLIILKLLELGGTDYCYPLAREYLGKTKSALSPLTNPVVLKGYNSLIGCLERSCNAA